MRQASGYLPLRPPSSNSSDDTASELQIDGDNDDEERQVSEAEQDVLVQKLFAEWIEVYDEQDDETSLKE